jgi:hypothetical protein
MPLMTRGDEESGLLVVVVAVATSLHLVGLSSRSR